MTEDIQNSVGRGRRGGKLAKVFRASLLSAGVCVGLSGCWVNTAGYIFDTASYDAKATTADIAVGNKVYEKDGSYYVYLPTYKTGKGPKLVYGIGAQDTRKERCQKDGHAYFRIPAPYAMYLAGLSDVEAKPELYQTDTTCGKSCKSWPVVRTVDGKAECGCSDSCTGSSLLQLFGLVDLVCVDIPMSAVCTSLMTVGSVGGGVYSLVKYCASGSEGAAAAAETAAAPVPDAPSPTSEVDSPEVRNQTEEEPARFQDNGVNACLKCKGSGQVLRTGMFVTPDGGSVQRKYYVTCPDCKGRGVKFSVPTSF